MKKLKVMLFANDTTYTYNLRKEIIEHLTKDGHEVLVVAKLLLMQDELRALGCRLVRIETNRHGTNPFSDFILLLKFRKILVEERPDIVLTYNIKPNVYGGIACRLTGTRYLANITGLGMAVEYPGIMQKITTNLYKVGIAGADCVFFQNEENRCFFISHNMLHNNCRTKLLPGSGVNLKIHRPMPYPEDIGTIHFLFVARVMQEKGIDLYLSAARQLCETHKNVMFHICGYCDDLKYINRLKVAQKKGYIKYHGEQKEMAPFFQMAHCIVHPSYYPEGMSNVLLEAAAHCRPVIATNRAGCREAVDDGKTGFLITVKDRESLVKSLEIFLAMSWTQKRDMGLAGRAKIEREFDRQFVVKAYINEIVQCRL